MKQAINFSLFFLASITLAAQNLTGIWRGYFITEGFEQYKFELQLKHRNNIISGVSYSYLSTIFYGKATLTGVYKRAEKSAVIKEIKTVELKMSIGSSACIMKCSFTYYKSGKEEFLEGIFTSVHEKNDSIYGYKAGEDCGGGTVYLRRVPTSDFYLEPFLRENVTTKIPPVQPPNTTQNPPVTNKSTTPAKPQTTPNKTTTQPSKTEMKSSDIGKTTTPVKPKPDIPKTQSIPALEKKSDTLVKKPAEKKLSEIKTGAPKVSIKVPEVLSSRTNELVRTLIITDPDVTLKIYDNGEIDDDTISVYVDKKLVLSNQRLSHSPIILKLKMDEDNSEHEVVMVAENLGRIPPNTSLMIVEAGDKRYDVRITSTEQKNAVIRFIYRKPD
jgi:hypothetical protein